MLTNREKQASRCRHDFEKLRLTEIVLICHFYNPGIDPQVGSDHTGHNFREAQYRCRKCGREICSPCYEDLMEAAEKATARETAEQQDESVTRHRGAFMESLMNDEEIEAHKDPSYEEVMEADGEGDPHGLYSAKVWNMSDAAKPSGAMYVGRAGHGEVGKWGNPFSLTKPLDATDVAKIYERLPMFAGLDYVREGTKLTREKSLVLYREYLAWALRHELLDITDLVEETEYGLRVRHLVCFCAPKPCHGHQLRDVAESYAFYRNERQYSHEAALDGAIYVHRGAA